MVHSAKEQPGRYWSDTEQIQLLGSSPTTGPRDRAFGKVSPLNLKEVLIGVAAEGMDRLVLLHPGAAAPQEHEGAAVGALR